MPKVPKKFKSVLAARLPPKPKQQQPKQSHTKTPQPIGKHSKPNTTTFKHISSSPASPAQWKCSSVIDQQSAEALEKLLLAAETRRGGATIKSLTLAPYVVHKKPTFAVTCETLKHLPLLKQLIAEVGLLEQQAHQLSPAAAYVLVYELLLGQGFRRKGPAEKAVLQQQDRLKSALQELLDQTGVQDAAAWLASNAQHQDQQQRPAVQHPRYARVNTLRASVQQVLAQLQKQQQQATPGHNTATVRGSSRSRNSSSSQGGGLSFRVDELLPDLLVFPPGTDLHDHPLVADGVLILQSKASCMPAHALQPGPGWHVVDCCAAPGNKTTHVAALLDANTAAAAQQHCSEDSASKLNKKKRSRQQAADALARDTAAGNAEASAGSCIKVFAFDKDPKRVKRLAANIDKAGAGHIVSAQRADFLSINPLDPQYAQVKGVILDPSCSGSGTVVSRMDHLLPSSTAAGGDGAGDVQEQQRVEQLAKFQEAALLHALQFPALQRLVYSTCSIHQRENEDVVSAVLPAAAAAGFRLANPFPAWHRRGLPVVEGGELLVRTDAHEDGTDGFFVAVFERSEGAANEHQQPLPGVEQPGGRQAGPAPHKKKKKRLGQ